MGLEDPGKMVMGEMDGVKIAVGVEGGRLKKVLEGGRGRQPRLSEAGRASRRMVEEDGPDVEDEMAQEGFEGDGGSVFEFGEDGLMV